MNWSPANYVCTTPAVLQDTSLPLALLTGERLYIWKKQTSEYQFREAASGGSCSLGASGATGWSCEAVCWTSWTFGLIRVELLLRNVVLWNQVMWRFSTRLYLPYMQARNQNSQVVQFKWNTSHTAWCVSHKISGLPFHEGVTSKEGYRKC